MVLVDPVTTAMSSPPGKSTTPTTHATKDGGSGSSSSDAPKTTQPIRILATPQAQAVRHTHPVLLLSLFLVRFRALVADPVPTMSNSLPVLVAIQAAYAIACLPPAGSHGSAKPTRKPRPGEKKKSSGSDASGPNITVVRYVTLYFISHATLSIL